MKAKKRTTKKAAKRKVMKRYMVEMVHPMPECVDETVEARGPKSAIEKVQKMWPDYEIENVICLDDPNFDWDEWQEENY